MRAIDAPGLADIEAARDRLAGLAVRTPLVRLSVESPAEIWLKLENLQPIGSFKLRGAANALAIAGRERIASGVYTASAGNMAQGVAWCARRLGVRCEAIVPEHAPATKLDAIQRLGGEIRKVPFDAWWQVILEHRFVELERALQGRFAALGQREVDREHDSGVMRVGVADEQARQPVFVGSGQG